MAGSSQHERREVPKSTCPSLMLPGASHGGVQEAQMSYLRSTSIKIHDGLPKVPRVSEDRSDGYFPYCLASCREPGPHR